MQLSLLISFYLISLVRNYVSYTGAIYIFLIEEYSNLLSRDFNWDENNRKPIIQDTF